jgi:hypothetical protein
MFYAERKVPNSNEKGRINKIITHREERFYIATCVKESVKIIQRR